MSNIQIGIDLGTTNSEIAINLKGNIVLVKNNLGDEFTPSVFGYSKSGDEIVGKKSYEKLYKDSTDQESKNNKAEIKRLMGTSEKIYFQRTNTYLLPEEISAKILSSLKIDALRKDNTCNLSSAVITIPAHFDTLQSEATKRAGEIAGFKHVVLLQEPIAAAISYGFGNSKNETWLVYDLGGGTFDCALISCVEGNLKVLSHSGNNFLGGKDIDACIVSKKIAPFIAQKYGLENFNKNNPIYTADFNKLKYFAEQAKIQLSRDSVVNIECDTVIDGKEIYENIVLKTDELETLTKGLIDETLELCKKTIQDANIQINSISKCVLVGGPTQLPFIRNRISQDLGITVDTSSDPLTAVARGACIYACSQAIPDNIFQERVIDDNSYNLNLYYEALTSEESELITAEIPELKDIEEDFFFQIQSSDNKYNSGRLKLKNGKFAIEVPIELHKSNLFYIYLFNSSGEQLKITTEDFTITHGLSISGIPLPQTIGVGISVQDNINAMLRQEYDRIFPKNAPLPQEKTITYKAIKTVKKGDNENCLPIIIYEGDEDIPNRNTEICKLEISGENLPYDIAKGDDIELTIKVSEAREVEVEAYIPIMNKSFNARATMYREEIDIFNIEQDINMEIERFEHLNSLCNEEERGEISEIISYIKQSINNIASDSDEKLKIEKMLRKLKANIDNIEKSKNIDILKKNFYENLEKCISMLGVVPETDAPEYEEKINSIKEQGNKAIIDNNSQLLSKYIELLNKLHLQIIFSNNQVWTLSFKHLITNQNYKDKQQAEFYINQGFEALHNGDFGLLKNSVTNLWALLPEEEIEQNKNIAGITK